MDQNKTTYTVRLRGKTYGVTPHQAAVVIVGVHDYGVFVGPRRSEAAGAFAMVRARCEIPSVNPDTEMHLFDQVLKELDNVGA